jgi:hypothetical protein
MNGTTFLRQNDLDSVFLHRVPLDKNEGVVKRQLLIAMLSSTAWISERWRTEALNLSQ